MIESINKIGNTRYIQPTGLLIFLLFASNIFSQKTNVNKHGLYVIDNPAVYLKTTTDQPDKKMIDLKKMIPALIIELKYCSRNNFMGKRLYPRQTTAFLRLPAASALNRVQQELAAMQLGLKIFDAYRPYRVTEKMWEAVKDDRYAADPKNGSGHNRGIAVDLTIIYLDNKQELDMGTGFDNFSDTAHHSFRALNENILQNRMLLKNIMEKHGFKALETEWWHYALPNARAYELLNISFRVLKKTSAN